jgi:cytoskeleton protein RodZ
MSGTIVPQRVADDEARVGSEVAAATQDVLKKSVEPMTSVGQQLQKARLAKGLTADEVAKALKLSPRQVVAMEDDNWSSLPCNTIIRGFVRNYARLLGLNADSLMGQLDTLTLPQGPELEVTVGTPVSMPAEGRVDRRDFARVLSGLLVLVLAVAAYFFFPQELWLSTLSALKTATQRDEVVIEKAPAEPEAANAPEAAPVQADAVPAAVQPTAAPAAAAVPAPATTPSAPATTSANVLKFSFAQPSWVEVRDRSGQVIFSKKNDAGTAREVEGQPPFAVVIGNAGHVTLQYKGKAVDLSKRSKEDVARLTLE